MGPSSLSVWLSFIHSPSVVAAQYRQRRLHKGENVGITVESKNKRCFIMTIINKCLINS